MNDQSKGRHKKVQQSRPLIFQRVRSKVTTPIPMSAGTAETLKRYVAWAAGQEGADEDEALILTADQAFGEFFKKDKLFMESLDDKTNPGISTTSTPPRTPGVSP